MPPERVADLLATFSEGVVRYPRATPETVLYLLPLLVYRRRAFERLTLAHHQMIYAAVGLAEDRNDLLAVHGEYEVVRVPGGRVVLNRGELGPVDHEELLAKVDAERPGLARVRAEETIAELVDLVLLWPDGQGGYHLLDDARYQFGLPQDPPSVEAGLGELDLPGIRRMALALGMDPTRERRTLTDDIERVLTSPERVRSLVRGAQPDIVHLILGHAFLGTEVDFFDQDGDGGAYRGRLFDFPVDGTGDPDLDWMIERGLLMPVDALSRRLVVPREVALAIRRSHPWPFSPAPQPVVGVPVDRMMSGGGADVAEGARRALTGLAGADTRLLAAVAERPPRLRKDGQLMKRERRRLTKAAGGEEDLARIWVEAGAVLGFLTAEDSRVVLSEQAVAWQDTDTEVRLASLAEAWAGTEDTALWWPAPESPPASRDREQAGQARVRWGLACALNDLPWGTSTGVAGERLLAERSEGRDLRTGARWLVAAATWYQPSTETEPDTEGRVLRALREAELLGLVFGGVTTEFGRALSARCRQAWDVWARGASGTVPAVRSTLGLAPSGDEREEGVGVVGPEEARHRELCEVARRLFGEEWA